MTPFAPHTSATAPDILYGPPLLIGPVIDPPGSSERSLSDAEVARIWLAAPQNDYGDILKLILLTGCRRGEIGDLKWSEVSEKIRRSHCHGSERRTDKSMSFRYPRKLGRLFAGPTILTRIRFRPNAAGGFSGWSKSKAEFDKLVNLKEPWTLHDLRRTVRTGLGKLGVAPHIAEATLNHFAAKADPNL